MRRFMACGIAGLSVAVDSFSAVRHARVQVFRASALSVAELPCERRRAAASP
ncbi:hypothetical protein [Streptomyces griseoflavus]|uniref:hypothetical protein n=1 Tax=Streptomyces griseoflavus TaxID=35619 RepID=UPI003D7153E2